MFCYNAGLRSIAQSGSASGLGPEGREFESLCSDHFPHLVSDTSAVRDQGLTDTLFVNPFFVFDKTKAAAKLWRPGTRYNKNFLTVAQLDRAAAF